MLSRLSIGTKVITTYEHSETGTVCRPTVVNLPLPSADWLIIKFDTDGKKACIHRSMLMVANQ